VRLRRWLPWVALVAVAAVALALGARSRGPATDAERVRAIAERVRCPTCRSQSAAESDAPASRAIREEIARRVAAGERDDQILAYFADRFGKDVILEPEGSGVAALVWALPVGAVVLGAAGLAAAFRRWRPRAAVPSDDDRRLVGEALGEAGGP
jgi:cytochrome c-type biogenesis protein CcmH